MNLAVSSESNSDVRVRLADSALLPTRAGEFKVYAFEIEGEDSGRDCVALVRGDLKGQSGVLTRVHSECLTGDVMGSLRCDCRDQLEASLAMVAEADSGLVIYLRQEGRGIGLANKIRAYALQDKGMDTVEANHALGFQDDLRQYDVAAQLLRFFGVESVRLMTNNPTKVEGLQTHGIVVEDRVALQARPNEHNWFYLETKRERSGHLL